MRTGPWKSPQLTFVLSALLFANTGLAQKDAAGETEAPPVQAAMVISFERPTIRENDKVPVHVVISNPSDKLLSNVTLTWSIPSGVLLLVPDRCESVSTPSEPSSPPPATVFPWTNIASNSDPGSVQTHDFCLVSTTAAEDTLNLLFTLQYAWTENGSLRHSAITVEKSIKSAFLGSDTLAGIPLGLASFIVPGLLFWLLLDWWQTPWRAQGNVLGDKMIYSVLVSAALVGLLDLIPPLKPYVNITSGLSMSKVLLLAGIGAVAGFVVGAGDHAWAWYRARQALSANDQELVLFAKLLRVNKGKRRPTTLVQTAAGTRYRGSVGARTAAGTFLMGWYGIQGAPEDVKKKIQRLLQSGDYTTALKTALKKNLTVTGRDYIYERPQGGEENQAAEQMRLVKNPDEVKQPLEVTDNAADPPPVVLE
jgi:hypothetical protein